ncbi:hypothetical protein K438DRAFT_1870458 [Mycena galopus ATCC 62051]|nr:hypothetical protein K438DRAFT_1870458 [Mycena galopus ATCC 62051]
MTAILNRPRTIAEAIQLQRHPVITYNSTSVATKQTSQAELALPRRLRSVQADRGWVEDVKKRYDFAAVQIPENYYATHPKLRACLDINQDPEPFEETQEADTHMFHRDHILQSASQLVAAYVTLGGLCNGIPFSQAAQDATASLKVRPGGRTDDSLIIPDHKFSLSVPSECRWLDHPRRSEPREAQLLIGEDKTHRVMGKLRPTIDTIVQDQSYEYPTSINGATRGTRGLTQVWSQMAASRNDGDPAAWINKLYASSQSPEEYHCFFRLVDEETMHISKWYSDSDSLENTVALLLYSLEQLYTHPDRRVLPSSAADRNAASATAVLSPSGAWLEHLVPAFPQFTILDFLWSTMRNIAQAILGRPSFHSTPPSLEVDPITLHVRLLRDNAPPIVFDEVAGKGATGTVLRSRAEKKILKFGSSHHILHEAHIYDKLGRCKDLAVPRYWGLYPFRAEQMAIILDDAGSSIEISALTHEQRSNLAHSIHRLHEFGVHHHDVFGNTVIDEEGTIRLVDFDQAELVPPGTACFSCDDRDSLLVLELET